MKIAPSLIAVNLMMIRETLSHKTIYYSGNDSFVNQVNSLIASTMSLVNSLNNEILSDSDYPVEDREDWHTLQRATYVLLDIYQTELSDFERDLEAHRSVTEYDNKM